MFLTIIGALSPQCQALHCLNCPFRDRDTPSSLTLFQAEARPRALLPRGMEGHNPKGQPLTGDPLTMATDLVLVLWRVKAQQCHRPVEPQPPGQEARSWPSAGSLQRERHRGPSLRCHLKDGRALPSCVLPSVCPSVPGPMGLMSSGMCLGRVAGTESLHPIPASTTAPFRGLQRHSIAA